MITAGGSKRDSLSHWNAVRGSPEAAYFGVLLHLLVSPEVVVEGLYFCSTLSEWRDQADAADLRKPDHEAAHTTPFQEAKPSWHLEVRQPGQVVQQVKAWFRVVVTWAQSEGQHADCQSVCCSFQ